MGFTDFIMNTFTGNSDQYKNVKEKRGSYNSLNLELKALEAHQVKVKETMVQAKELAEEYKERLEEIEIEYAPYKAKFLDAEMEDGTKFGVFISEKYKKYAKGNITPENFHGNVDTYNDYVEKLLVLKQEIDQCMALEVERKELRHKVDKFTLYWKKMEIEMIGNISKISSLRHEVNAAGRASRDAEWKRKYHNKTR